MIYLSTFAISEKRMRNPNVYPYNVFRSKEIYPLVFAPITIIYGNNGSALADHQRLGILLQFDVEA